MPTSSFLKQSRNKMQAWVTNNPALHHGQSPVVAPLTSSAPARPSSQTQSQPRQQPQPQKRVVNLSQPTANSAPPMSQNQLQQPSPPRSRAPIANVNSQRAATANPPRLPVPTRPSHPRETNLNLPRHKSIPSESLQNTNRPQGPFWDQSTVDGSAFSDSASNVGSNAQHGYRHRPEQPMYFNYQQIASPHRHRPSPRKVDLIDQPGQMLMGADGLIGGIPNENGLARSSSTPDATAFRHGFKDTLGGNGREPYSDDSAYEQSPEKTPSVKRLHHPFKTMTLRNGRGESFAERNHHFNEDGTIPTISKQEIEVKLDDGVRDQALQVPQLRLPKIQTSEHEVRRSTIFADTDTPMISHQDEAEARSAIEERVPTPKPAVKNKPQTSRQLFKNESKSKGGLRESALPRAGQEKQHTTSKKRSLELDYDDGQLSSMEYSRLKQEKFDYDPAQAEARSAVGPPEGTLAEKLKHFHDKDEAKQAEFFTKMSIKEWEQSGDWFMESFGSLMQGFKAARVAKREVIESFENEIADREEAVRNKMQGIGQTLAELKSEGSKMILNKEMD
ncbi:extracellular mutant protein 11-domain-containing protein [Xylariaceae sp. FL1019]|nr:extracellular mutant protein 11-domain-containing protein [Xylariaceae sp. FL1019]